MRRLPRPWSGRPITVCVLTPTTQSARYPSGARRSARTRASVGGTGRASTTAPGRHAVVLPDPSRPCTKRLGPLNEGHSRPTIVRTRGGPRHSPPVHGPAARCSACPASRDVVAAEPNEEQRHRWRLPDPSARASTVTPGKRCLKDGDGVAVLLRRCGTSSVSTAPLAHHLVVCDIIPRV